MNRLKICIATLAATIAFGAAGAYAQEKVVLRTDYRFNGYVAPFALALERGFYKEAGIDVSIEQGQGSGTTVQTVGSGADTFGLADSATMVLGATAQNIPVKLLAVYTQTATMGLIYHANGDFKGDIADIKDKVVISSAGAADLRMLNPALASAGLSQADVQIQLVETNARVPLFLQTPNALLTGFATGDLLRVRAMEPDAKYVPYADFGVIAYGTGLIASETTISSKPELVKGFVAASQRGWEEAVKDPEAAVAASLKLYPDLDAKLLRDGLQVAIDSQLHTPATKDHPIGWTDEGDWEKMLKILADYADLSPREPSSYYTNEFIAE